MGKLAKRFIDLIMINVSSNPFHFGFVIPSQAIDAVVWLRTDLVSKKPMRIRAFNSRMIDGSFTHDQRMAIFRRDKGVCPAGQDCSWDNWEADHKLPWSHGGKTTVENGQVACLARNASKGGMIQPAA